MVFDCVNAIKNADLAGSYRIGDVIIKNVLGTGSDVVATRNIL
jgi:CxxC motif-containing protein